MNNNVLTQNKQSWDAIADEWFGTTALPIWGCSVPTEDELHLLENGDIKTDNVSLSALLKSTKSV